MTLTSEISPKMMEQCNPYCTPTQLINNLHITRFMSGITFRNLLYTVGDNEIEKQDYATITRNIIKVVREHFINYKLILNSKRNEFLALYHKTNYTADFLAEKLNSSEQVITTILREDTLPKVNVTYVKMYNALRLNLIDKNNDEMFKNVNSYDYIRFMIMMLEINDGYHLKSKKQISTELNLDVKYLNNPEIICQNEKLYFNTIRMMRLKYNQIQLKNKKRIIKKKKSNKESKHIITSFIGKDKFTLNANNSAFYFNNKKNLQEFLNPNNEEIVKIKNMTSKQVNQISKSIAVNPNVKILHSELTKILGIGKARTLKYLVNNAKKVRCQSPDKFLLAYDGIGIAPKALRPTSFIMDNETYAKLRILAKYWMPNINERRALGCYITFLFQNAVEEVHLFK